MTQTLRLHYAPDNASLCVRLALEELGLPYETALVDRSRKEQESDAFLALNPNGLIPVLETAEGPLFETAAILLWLAEREGLLMPAVGTPAHMHAIQWIIWLANTLHPTLRMMFYPAQYTTGDHAPIRSMAAKRLTAHLDILSTAQTAGWLDDTEPTIHTCYLAPMLRWAALYGGGDVRFDLAQWPRLLAFAKSFEARDSAQTLSKAEGLGPTPFSNPSPCDPPEGSAL
ncbi:MAG: glutathione S-transferase family protein [Pseudomonadota bacterium]